MLAPSDLPLLKAESFDGSDKYRKLPKATESYRKLPKDAERYRKLVGQMRRLAVAVSCQWSGFWATVCKIVRPTLSDRCLSVLSVCNVGVLWPNGWMDQDETSHAGRSRSWRHLYSAFGRAAITLDIGPHCSSL